MDAEDPDTIPEEEGEENGGSGNLVEEPSSCQEESA
jgi:hypothetical protein